MIFVYPTKIISESLFDIMMILASFVSITNVQHPLAKCNMHISNIKNDRWDLFLHSDPNALSLFKIEKRVICLWHDLGDCMWEVDNVANYYYQAYKAGYSIGETTEKRMLGFGLRELCERRDIYIMIPPTLCESYINNNNLYG